MKISIYKSIEQPYDKNYIDIDVAFERIKDSKYKEHIEKMREVWPSSEYDDLKKTLPCYRFSGVFDYGNDAGIKEHSGLICLDFDKYKDVIDQIAERERLVADKHTYALFLSPSGRGYKVLVKIPKDIENHREYFLALEKYYNSPNWDGSSINISRNCFDSYDPEMYINKDSEVFTERVKEVEELEYNTYVDIPVKSSNEIIKRVQKWFDDKYNPNERNNSLFKLASALNRFGINESEADSHIRSMYGSNGLPSSEFDQIIRSGYRNKDEHGMSSFEDTEIIKYTKRELSKGNKPKNIKAKLLNYNTDEKELIIEKAQKELKNFWKKTDKGKIVVSPSVYKKYLSEKGFYKYHNSELSYIFIKIENNFINEVNEDIIKDFVLNEVAKEDDIEVFDYLASATRYFKKDFLSFMEAKDVSFIRDEQEKAYLFFNNCLVEVTKDTIQELNYADFEQHVWKKQVIDRDFKPGTDDCDFKQFVRNVSSNEDRYNSFRSVIGYLMHTYKTPFYSPAIILNDENISENPEGGTGKGLVVEAIGKFKNLCTINGKNFDPSKDFAFQRVSLDTQVLFFDDVQEHFNFESLFSIITDGMPINKKNKDEFFIDKDKTPKIVIPTNYVLKGDGNSHERRKFEIELNNHYSKDYTPYHDFKRNLFYDWDATEWSKFDNFMIGCVQYFLQNGLVEYDRINLAEKKLKASLGADFMEWILENIVYNKRWKMKEIWDAFKEEHKVYSKFSQKYTSVRIVKYAKFLKKKGEIDDFKQGKENGSPFIEIINNKFIQDDKISDDPF